MFQISKDDGNKTQVIEKTTISGKILYHKPIDESIRFDVYDQEQNFIESFNNPSTNDGNFSTDKSTNIHIFFYPICYSNFKPALII